MGLPVQPNGASMAKYPTKPDVLPEVDSGIINNSSNTQSLAIKKGLDHGSRLGVLGRTLSIYSRNTHLQMMHHQLCDFRPTDMYIAHSQPSPVRVIAALVCIPLSCSVWLRLDPTDAHQHHTSQKHHRRERPTAPSRHLGRRLFLERLPPSRGFVTTLFSFGTLLCWLTTRTLLCSLATSLNCA